jgi:hypothetical protein
LRDQSAPLYERIPGESEEAFRAFQIYRDLGLGARSINAVAQKLHDDSSKQGGIVLRFKSQGTGGAPDGHRKKKTGRLGEWSRKFNWVDRAAEWDKHVDRVIQRRQLDDIQKMSKRHSQQAQLVMDVLMRPVVALAEALQDPEKLSRVARINDPMAPMAELLQSPFLMNLHEMAVNAAAKMPRIQEAERLSRGVRLKDVREGPTEGGTAVWEVEVYQPPREGPELDLSTITDVERTPWEGDKPRSRHDDD